MTAPATLDAIRDEAGRDLYPLRVLEGCETALVLFAAGFHGRQDAYWIAEAGIRGTCVDHDADKLGEMAAVYPRGWTFIPADVYEYAEATGEMWDVVSIDCPSNHFERCAALVPLWCNLARKAVVLGANRESASTVRRSPGWAMTELRRRSDFAGGSYWAVLELPV